MNRLPALPPSRRRAPGRVLEPWWACGLRGRHRPGPLPTGAIVIPSIRSRCPGMKTSVRAPPGPSRPRGIHIKARPSFRRHKSATVPAPTPRHPPAGATGETPANRSVFLPDPGRMTPEPSPQTRVRPLTAALDMIKRLTARCPGFNKRHAGCDEAFRGEGRADRALLWSHLFFFPRAITSPGWNIMEPVKHRSKADRAGILLRLCSKHSSFFEKLSRAGRWALGEISGVCSRENRRRDSPPPRPPG